MPSTSETSPGRQNGTTISVVVPVLNDAVRLERCLRSVKANHYPEHLVEIIVGDNGSVDDSPAVAARLGATVLRLPGMKVSKVRNEVSRTATGSILAFIDADHEVVPDWLERAVTALAEPAVVGVGAAPSPPRNGTWVQRLYDGLRGPTRGRGPTEWLGAGNLAVCRKAFADVGGFDESLQTCEDVDLCQRLREKGILLADEALGSTHFGDPDSLQAILRGELWRGRDNLRVSLRGQLSMRALPSIVIPVLDDVFLFIAVGALLAGAPSTAALASAAFVLFSMLRSAKILAHVDRPRLRDVPGAFAVAVAYDLGRALSLLIPASHATRRRTVHA